MIARRAALWVLPFVFAACSSSTSSDDDAGGTDAAPHVDGSSEASSEAGDAEAAEPPPYDFDVKCQSDPCVTRLTARGGGHACALLRDGSVRCWGANESGQLGTGVADGAADIEYAAKPQLVVGAFSAASVTASGHEGLGTTCILSAAGEIACFGSDAWGQLGRDSSPSFTPHPEAAVVEGLRAKSVVLAGSFAMAVDTDDHLWTWGSNDAVQLARSTLNPEGGPPTRPGRADRVSNAVRGCAGTLENGYALTADGLVLSWGGEGALGRTTSTAFDPIARAVALSEVSSLTTGSAHGCALRRGSVHCWGSNDRGQLGVGNEASSVSPLRAATPAGVYAVAVSAGGSNTCAISADGAVYCWGANDSGQLGSSAGEDRPMPERIDGLNEQAVGVAIMDKSICVLLRGGSVTCRGDNLMGQLGRGTRDHELHLEVAPVVFQ